MVNCCCVVCWKQLILPWTLITNPGQFRYQSVIMFKVIHSAQNLTLFYFWFLKKNLYISLFHKPGKNKSLIFGVLFLWPPLNEPLFQSGIKIIRHFLYDINLCSEVQFWWECQTWTSNLILRTPSIAKIMSKMWGHMWFVGS